MREVILLGASGSIGKQTLELLRYNHKYKLVGISLKSNTELIEDELLYFDSLKTIAIIDEEKALLFKKEHPGYNVISGANCNKVLINKFNKATVINAIMGNDGLIPTLLALKNNQDLLLSNKESLVIGSSLFNKYKSESTSKVFPIDSEHVGLAKLLNYLKENKIPIEKIEKLIVTASGGSLRDKKIEELDKVKVEDVLKHPTWKMSNKITVDSATLINKAFEVIEASVLFSFPIDKVDAIICRESLIHAQIVYDDRNKKKTIEELSPCDMRVAINYALSYGKEKMHNIWKGDDKILSSLHLEKIDDKKYPLFKYTINFYKTYGNYGMIFFNELDSLLIDSFIKKEIEYLDIYKGLKMLPKFVETNKEINISTFEEITLKAKSVSKLILNEIKGGL